MDFPVKVDLTRPITLDGKEIRALVFDEPDLGTSIAVEEASTPWQQTVVLLAGMAGVSVEVIRRVKESDFRTIARVVMDPYQQMQQDRAVQDAVGNGQGGNAPAPT